jgi:hypothetical protein
MRLIERHYCLQNLVDWVVPVGWVLVARWLHFRTWLFPVGLVIGFFASNYRITLSGQVPDPPAIPRRREPLYFEPGFWLLVSLAVYLAYFVLRSQWLLYYLLIAGSIGACVATYLRWHNKVSS